MLQLLIIINVISVNKIFLLISEIEIVYSNSDRTGQHFFEIKFYNNFLLLLSALLTEIPLLSNSKIITII